MAVDINWVRQRFPEIISPQPLGKGGQKLVFVGRHAQDGDVVLKLFHLGADEAKAIREVSAVHNVASPRVPRIYAEGKITSPLGDIIWVREQMIPGQDLRAILVRRQMPPREILTLASHMLEALTDAERKRIVHRDIKPENIRAASDGSFWLLDFGLARHLDLESLTPTAMAFGSGTPGYMPVEQFRNRKKDIDARADLYGLGVTLYECAEGVNPFIQGARDGNEVMRRTERQILPHIQRRIDAAGSFRDLVHAMTRTLPDHRLESAADALTWVREICTAEGVS